MPTIYGGKEMTIQEAKNYVGAQLHVSWNGRNGEKSEIVHVLTVGFVPLYGPCLITDIGEISLDRVVSYTCFEQQAAA